MHTQMRTTVVSMGSAATNNGNASAARTVPAKATNGRAAKPTQKLPRHGRSESIWITYATTTRKMRKIGTTGQKTLERQVPMHKGTRSDWNEDFPPLPSPTAKGACVVVESRVLPVKDIKTPGSQLPSQPTVVVAQNSKREEVRRMAKDIHVGGGDGATEQKEPRSARRMRFAKTVNVRLFGLDGGNENTHPRVMTHAIGEDVVRITKAATSSGVTKEPTTDEAQANVDRANNATANWTLPSNDATYESVSVDSRSFNSDESDGDDTLALYEQEEMERIFDREMFDPVMFQQLTLQFAIFEQLPLMSNRNWWYETEQLCHQSQKPVPTSRTTEDHFLGQDAIYAGLLKTLIDTGSNEYAVSYPVDITLDYTVEALRANIVRKPGASWILLPILIQKHWILACYHPATSRVIIHDSLYHGYNKTRKELTIEWVQCLFDEIVDDDNITLSVKFARRDYSFHQSNGVDCGIYVLLHAQRFMLGRRKLVGREEDRNINLMQERRNLLGLMRCMENYIDSKYHYNDPVQQYDQHPIQYSHIRQIRRSPRNLTAQVQRIRDCVAELNKGRCKAVKRRKRVSVAATNTTANTTSAAGLTTPGSPTMGTDTLSVGSPPLPAQSQSPTSSGSPPNLLISTADLSANLVYSPTTTSGSPQNELDSSTITVARKRRLAESNESRGAPSKRQRLCPDSDEDITAIDQVTRTILPSPQLSSRELRAQNRLERIEEDGMNGEEVRRGTKRRRRSGEEEIEIRDGQQDTKKQRLDPGKRGQKRRSKMEDDDTGMKRRRDDAPADDEAPNVTRRGARNTRRRSSGAALIGSRQ